MPGAPTISGTEDATHFYNQPPPVSGLSIGPDTSDAQTATNNLSLNELHEKPTPSPHAETGQSTPAPRARFPEDENELQQVFSARPIPIGPRASQQGGERDREPSAHRGAWQAFRNWLNEWREDFGSPQAHQDISTLIGDAGIDPQILRKVKSGRNVASLVSFVAFDSALCIVSLPWTSPSTYIRLGGPITDDRTARPWPT